MGVQVRPRKEQKGDCGCFILPTKKTMEYLCFKKNFVGALSDAQQKELCTRKSFISEKEGGLAKDVDSKEVENLMRTINEFRVLVGEAKEKYATSGERDISVWRKCIENIADGKPCVEKEGVPTVKTPHVRAIETPAPDEEEEVTPVRRKKTKKTPIRYEPEFLKAKETLAKAQRKEILSEAKAEQVRELP